MTIMSCATIHTYDYNYMLCMHAVKAVMVSSDAKVSGCYH